MRAPRRLFVSHYRTCDLIRRGQLPPPNTRFSRGSWRGEARGHAPPVPEALLPVAAIQTLPCGHAAPACPANDTDATARSPEARPLGASSLHAWGVRGRPHAVLRRADTLAPCYRRVSPGTRTHPQELVPAAPRGGRGAETESRSCAWILLFFLSFVFIYLFIYFLMRKGSMWPQVSLDTALCIVVWSLA